MNFIERKNKEHRMLKVDALLGRRWLCKREGIRSMRAYLFSMFRNIYDVKWI